MASLQARLERLQAILHKSVRLADPEEVSMLSTEATQREPDACQPRLAVDAGSADLVPDSSGWAARRHDAEKCERDLRRKQAFDCSTFRAGEAIGENETFCPLNVMITYPDHFIGKTNRPLAKPFFDRILLDNTWDFFYLHDPTEPQSDPYLLVPTIQFEAFLEMINAELGISLRIPNNGNQESQEKFCMTFGQGGTPRPRYLRRSEDEASLDVRPWPMINQTDIDNFTAGPVHMQDDWKEKMKLVKTGIGKKGNKEKEARSQLKQAERRQMLLRAQRYLGLKEEPFAQDIVFLCVDIEAIERPPNPVSEIGFAILNTKDIREISPGHNGRNWWTMIDCHHIRVKEYAGLVNHRYVMGCPDNFDFGESIMRPKADVQREIMSILAPYENKTISLVLVGHDVQQDLRWVSRFGVNLPRLSNVIGHLDTKDLFQGWREEASPRGLSRVLAVLDIPSKHLHNAGNDAYYTMCAMLGIALGELRDGEDKNKENTHG
ncbi:hypothetical protein B0T10DRAFT_557084 [Thelonectria olida]|uniref:Gfd2/YDR514C-like C-terminal domain-containing protein n=1 Tax=Thelonectria olida TaxID=1576542 RepID=A0A9P8WFD8_9HYPO|nr:hypothetical protein B0T10DRAFT_557084 [Thelonectria olida]